MVCLFVPIVNHPSWRNNPQFALTLTGQGPLTVTLEQGTESEEPTFAGFLVVRAENKLDAPPTGDAVVLESQVRFFIFYFLF